MKGYPDRFPSVGTAATGSSNAVAQASSLGPECVGEQCLGPDDYANASQVFDAVSDALRSIEEVCGLKCDVASTIIPGGIVVKASKVLKTEKVRELGQFLCPVPL